MPVLGQFPQVVRRDTAVPAGAGYLVRPAGAGQPVVQVIEVGWRDVDPERPDLGPIGHGSLLVC
jgi:hypothetical protein